MDANASLPPRRGHGSRFRTLSERIQVRKRVQRAARVKLQRVVPATPSLERLGRAGESASRSGHALAGHGHALAESPARPSRSLAFPVVSITFSLNALEGDVY
jgi:hypothetical protein